MTNQELTQAFDERVKKARQLAEDNKYIQQGGNNCLSCGHDDIEGGSVQTDGGQAWQEVECQGCGSTWVDVYKLSYVEDVEINNN